MYVVITVCALESKRACTKRLGLWECFSDGQLGWCRGLLQWV